MWEDLDLELLKDERGFPRSISNGRMPSIRGSHVYEVVYNNKQHIPDLNGMNAIGDYIPTRILVPSDVQGFRLTHTQMPYMVCQRMAG